MCVCDCKVALLDFVLHSADSLIVKWPRNLVPDAVRYGRLEVLEWWELHQDQLPVPDLTDCAQALTWAAREDAVDVLAWWHARQLPMPMTTWRELFINAVLSSSCQVQMCHCVSNLGMRTALYTLGFIGAIFPTLDSAALPPLPKEAHACTTIFESLFDWSNIAMLEWWLQAYLAAGHSFVLFDEDKLDEFDNRDQDVHQWLYDVMITRKIPLFVKSKRGEIMWYLGPEGQAE
ncbi:hypothetical protein BC828DRAFT_417447 [Blastocladiella britannica]|nr:hypothetical protein BC828DRAFT_417447 [Blastocladiella britannica]